MKDFKGTKGNWEIIYVNNLPIGLGVLIEQTEFDNYYKSICEIILPDTDEEWELEKEEQTANLKLIENAPELLELVRFFLDTYEPEKAWIREEFEKAKIVINKIMG